MQNNIAAQSHHLPAAAASAGPAGRLILHCFGDSSEQHILSSLVATPGTWQASSALQAFPAYLAKAVKTEG